RGFEFEIAYAVAAGLIDPPHRRLESQRHRERVIRGALEREIAEFGESAGQRHLVAVREIVHAADIVGRSERTEFDLDELGRRKLELVFGFGRRVAAVALAEPGDGVDGEFLLALEADAGAGGKSENV